ncbi:transferase hexapeptide (six repeat-containing protein) [Malonomonas rubra DSM 5091]|uniref:Transferase hexapeptide (Six repeat-containing protein) n=1 Tax=Malonomonas rubra DSM 5091 TaxID=1122189 RepID=A0A1M6KDP9_MALRU|nr:acyltransferase [Malonomonas rubra]SHJ57073.1 transferase hexapeptide (six repeat-containing protein) [Malonomonas rubra DSM 5091]
MRNDFFKTMLAFGFRIRDLINTGPAWTFYQLFWWCYPATVLRNKAAHNPYANLRAHLLRLSGIPVGKDTCIGYGALVLGLAKEPPAVTFGERVAVAPYVTFVSSSYPDLSRLNEHPEVKPMIRKLGPIIVEDDCWIGAGAIIFPDVVLGKGSIIGSGAVVRQNVEPYSIIAGNPGKCLRQLAC